MENHKLYQKDMRIYVTTAKLHNTHCKSDETPLKKEKTGIFLLVK